MGEPHKLTASRLKSDLVESYREWSSDNAPQFAGAIAFYTILSLGPLLVFSIMIATFFFEAAAARGEIVASVEQYIGAGAAEFVERLVRNASENRTGVLASIIGFVVLAFGASRIFQQLKIALNAILDVPTAEEGGLRKIVMDRIFAIVAVGGVGLFLMASILVNGILGRIGDTVPIPGGSVLWQVVSHVFSLGLIAVVFALILRYLPDIDSPWRHVWEGAVFTAVLFTFGQIAISLYLAKANPGSSFGAAGPVIVVIVWIYFTMVIFFFGAEFMEVRCRADAAFSARRRRGEASEPRKMPPDATALETPTNTPAPSKKNVGGGKIAVSAFLGGCLGMVAGITTAMLGLFVVSVKLVSSLFSRR